MIKAVARVLWPVFFLVSSAVVRAEFVRDLYSAQVPVASQDSRALKLASREALAEVLVKVSGSLSVLQNPVIVAALPESRSQVQQYAYTRDDARDGQLAARFEFDASYVTRLLTQAGEPLWTANRPAVLLWLVMEDSRGRYFVNWESAPGLSAQLMTEFSRRGVPVQVPLFDLADSTAISTEQAWRLYAPALQAASGRYDVQDIMAGRLAALSGGQSVGDWTYFHGAERIDRSVTTADAQAFVRVGVGIVAEEMAARYAVAPSIAVAGGVLMSVTGVSSYADYAGIVAWLEGLELIEHANVSRISGDRVELRLHAQADARQLAAIIELNQRLVPLARETVGDQLRYQWQ